MKPQKLFLIHVLSLLLLVLTSLQKKGNCIHRYHKKYINQINSGNDKISRKNETSLNSDSDRPGLGAHGC